MPRRSAVSKYLAEIGARGGKARVAKGVATLSAGERTERAKAAAAARWNPKPGTERK